MFYTYSAGVPKGHAEAGLQRFLGRKCGIELPPRLGSLCAHNYSSVIGSTAITQVLALSGDTSRLPALKTPLVTTEENLYSVVTMALLELHHEGINVPIANRARMVARSHVFVREWRAYELPRWNNVWPQSLQETMYGEKLAEMVEMSTDVSLPLEQKVAHAAEWLKHKGLPEIYKQKALSSRQALVDTIENRHVQVGLAARDSRIAVVEVYRACSKTTIQLVGLSCSKLMVVNDCTGRTFRVEQIKPGFLDMPKLVSALSELESGWRFSTLAAESRPASDLEMRDVVRIVSRHIR